MKRGLKNNTFENYKYMYETFVRQQIGSKTVSSLKKSDIKRFYNYLADERHLKPATIDNIHTVLHQILDMAVDEMCIRDSSQRDVVDEIDLNDATPSHDQTIRMRKFFEEGKLTTEAIQAIMSEEKPNQREKIVLRGDRVRQLIPKNIPISQTEDFVCKALEHYNKFLRSRADRDSR